MCFVLYAGTDKPLPRSAFNPEAPAVWVTSLTEHDAAIKAFFSKPEVQYIGSTSQCGCDFPHAILQNGDWPEIEVAMALERDPNEMPNREALVALLGSSGESTIELYGLWDGDFSETPKTRETIPLGRILDTGFFVQGAGFLYGADSGVRPDFFVLLSAPATHARGAIRQSGVGLIFRLPRT